MNKAEILNKKNQEFNQASIEHWLPTEIRVLGLKRVTQGDRGEYPILELGFGSSGKENIRYTVLSPTDAKASSWQEEPITLNPLFDTPFGELDSQARFTINHNCSQFAGRRIMTEPIPQEMKEKFSERIARSLLNNVIFGQPEETR